MKNNIIKTVVTVAMLALAVKGSAQGTVTFTQLLDGSPEKCAQDILYDIKDGVCTLTVLNMGDPYTVESMEAIKIINGELAQSRRQAPGFTSPIEVTKKDDGSYTFNASGEYDYEVTVNFTYDLFGISVNGVPINGKNLFDVFEQGDSAVSYDGKGTLILKKYVNPDAIIQCDGALTIYFTGDNKVKAINGGANSELTFITDQNRPGTLVIGSEGSEDAIFSGFTTFTIGKGLSQLTPANGSLSQQGLSLAEIGPIIQPILNNESQGGQGGGGGGEDPQIPPVEVIFPKEDSNIDDEGATNIIINDVVITLTTDDGFVELEDNVDKVAVVLNTPVEPEKMDDVADKVNKGDLKPGSDEFAQHFTGLTFLIPGGTGDIILEMDLDEGAVLAVKVDTLAPVTFTKSTLEEGKAKIHYVCTEPVYVYIYDATPAETLARMYAANRVVRRERKTGGHIRLTSFLVDPEGVLEQSAPEAQKIVSALTNETLAFHEGQKDLKVNDASINSLIDGFFRTVCGTALNDIRTINLAETGITGVEVSRSRGAFQDVPDDAVIYMPAGNTAAEGESNVVIGGVCNNLQMPGDNQTYEGMDMDFSAQTVNFGREFAEERTSTVFLPFAIDKVTAASLGSFYTFDGIDENGDAKLKEVETGTEAHTPYIFIKHNSTGGLIVNNVKVTGGLPNDYKCAELIGTYEAKTFTSSDLEGKFYYGYAAEDKDGVKAGEFVRIGDGATIKPYRAYLELATDHGARIAIDWDGSLAGITTLHNVQGTMHNNVYDLQGRRVSAEPNASLSTVHASLKKGIYVRNGKKIIVK